MYELDYASPIGNLILVSDGESLTRLERIDPAGRRDDCTIPRRTAQELDEYFAGGNPDVARLSLAPIGSAYRQVVWQLLREIPFGQVRTYGEIAAEAARRMGKERGSARAVGGAVGHNPISIIVPCHRVMGAGGNLTGFGGGIARKLQLLEHEGADCAGFYVPKHSTAP